MTTTRHLDGSTWPDVNEPGWDNVSPGLSFRPDARTRNDPILIGQTEVIRVRNRVGLMVRARWPDRPDLAAPFILLQDIRMSAFARTHPNHIDFLYVGGGPSPDRAVDVVIRNVRLDQSELTPKTPTAPDPRQGVLGLLLTDGHFGHVHIDNLHSHHLAHSHQIDLRGGSMKRLLVTHSYGESFTLQGAPGSLTEAAYLGEGITWRENRLPIGLPGAKVVRITEGGV